MITCKGKHFLGKIKKNSYLTENNLDGHFNYLSFFPFPLSF